jgi:predicted lipid carrier protein YhbT
MGAPGPPQRVLAAAVRRMSPARLEGTVGRPAVLDRLFAAIARRYDPAAVPGFTGEVQIDLRRGRSPALEHRTLTMAGGRASARRGAASDPAATVTVAVADLLRLAAGEADAGRLLLDGRLDLAGDWEVASRLGPMFGRPEGG